MELKIRAGHLMKMIEKGSKNKIIRESIRYSSAEHKVAMAFDAFSEKEVEELSDIADKAGDIGLVKKLSSFSKLQDDPSGAPVGRLQLLSQAIKNTMKPLPNKWLFSEAYRDGQLCAYFVDGIRYHERSRETPAYVRVSMSYMKQGEKANYSFTFGQEDLQGKTPIDLLNSKGFFLEKPELVTQYEEDMKKYMERCVLTGHQFTARGVGSSVGDSWYDRGTVAMEREGRLTKVVMDDLHHREKKGNRADSNQEDASFWYPAKSQEELEEGESTTPMVTLPYHPLVVVFDLEKHQFVRLHVSNLEPYKWDTSLGEKLVLPEEKKNLVDMLVQGSEMLMEDIIKGKTGGVIILATGLPGTGKTLTAEVYSEVIKAPLYVVQCSQLGTDEEVLEKSLTGVLSRASRWKAILLIDEADVYVHERGSDIRQNAIVGVFLRVLEYYRGVLFLTSNRATIIDDAIISRATAHIHYELPTAEELERIWKVLAKQFKIELAPSVVAELVKKFPKISGRNVKNLLKLSSMLAMKQKGKVTAKLVEYASQFLDVGDSKK